MTEVPFKGQQEVEPPSLSIVGMIEVDECSFSSISSDNKRITVLGDGGRLGILISSICAMWSQKWRKYGAKLPAAGILLIFTGLFLFPFLFRVFIIELSMFFFFIGGVVITVWLVAKAEAVMLYTSGGTFKFEGNSSVITPLREWIVAVQNKNQ